MTSSDLELGRARRSSRTRSCQPWAHSRKARDHDCDTLERKRDSRSSRSSRTSNEAPSADRSRDGRGGCGVHHCYVLYLCFIAFLLPWALTNVIDLTAGKPHRTVTHVYERLMVEIECLLWRASPSEREISHAEAYLRSRDV